MRKRTYRLAGGCLFVALGWLLAQANPFAAAQPSSGKNLPPGADIEKNIVAYVNNVPITRQELAEELIARKGKKQLELLINRKIIEQAAQKAGVTVSETEIEADLRDFVKTSGCNNVADFEKRVLKEKQTNLYEYREDVIRPAILMRKLAGQRVELTDDELKRGFEAKYGTKVQCRVILVPDKKSADQLYTEILASLSSGEPNALYGAFMRRAKTQANPTLAAGGGLIEISHHGLYSEMEKRAFQMQDNEMSEVMHTPEGFVILFREKLLPAKAGKKFEDEKESLRKEFAENKLRVEVPRLFKELRDKAAIRDYLNAKGNLMDIMINDFSSLTPNK